MNIPMIKVLNVNWGSPLESKTYKEIGMLMVEILPYIYEVKHADDEGAIIHVLVGEDQEEEIKELRKHFLYIDVWFEEEEDPEEIKKQRLLRWAEKKVKRND
ncbi:hypothetical protein WIW89_06705 [Stygiolobus sp. CP850M]|jgi:hypothetical protein|uniref:hypothetical protein n=1 Tax=Stygiolobus sp. CP850M TaxID=3133134 RepID=UPI00307F1296